MKFIEVIEARRKAHPIDVEFESVIELFCSSRDWFYEIESDADFFTVKITPAPGDLVTKEQHDCVRHLFTAFGWPETVIQFKEIEDTGEGE